MGLFQRLFGKPTTIENDFFGNMRFVAFEKNPSRSYFECQRHFQPIGKKIPIGVTITPLPSPCRI